MRNDDKLVSFHDILLRHEEIEGINYRSQTMNNEQEQDWNDFQPQNDIEFWLSKLSTTVW